MRTFVWLLCHRRWPKYIQIGVSMCTLLVFRTALTLSLKTNSIQAICLLLTASKLRMRQSTNDDTGHISIFSRPVSVDVPSPASKSSELVVPAHDSETTLSVSSPRVHKMGFRPRLKQRDMQTCLRTRKFMNVWPTRFTFNNKNVFNSRWHHLGFKELVSFLYNLKCRHQIRWKCCEFDVLRLLTSRFSKKCSLTKIQDSRWSHLGCRNTVLRHIVFTKIVAVSLTLDSASSNLVRML